MRVSKRLKVYSSAAVILALVWAQILFVRVNVSADEPLATPLSALVSTGEPPAATATPPPTTVVDTTLTVADLPPVEPPTSTPVSPGAQPGGVVLASATPTPAEDTSAVPTNQPAATPPPAGEPTATPAPTATAAPLPTSTPTPEPPAPVTAHLAVLVSESVIPIGATGRSEVLVYLQNLDPGIQAFEVVLAYNPDIVQIADADGQAGNGVQVAPAAFFGDGQVVTANRADNAAGKLILALAQGKGPAVKETGTWRKVATVTWIGQQEGNSVVAINETTTFASEDGRRIVPDAAHNGTLFVRQPGKIAGTVKMQGRQNSAGVAISGLLSTANVDQAQTDRNGNFVVVTSHGEGFYTVTAAAPGYLSAAGDRPVKVTVGSVVDLGEVTLLGGDVNGDDRIDIRDVSYIAFHFGQVDTQGDTNRDGRVDILDLTLTAGNFGKTGPTVWQLPD